ncbi:MAG: type IV secretion system protein VirB3 [Sphingomonas bacterium]|jgi:type IV secretion system protein VirB3|nr:type IV secretion system protein VirB3 [Sphingomonas bacterium]
MAEKLTEDTLFLAVTRPAMVLGVPIEAFVPIALGSVMALIITGNPLYALGMGGAALAASRLIVRHDPNTFRLMMLWTYTKARCVNRGFWGGSSYSPLPTDGYRRKGFGRG